MRRLPIAVSSTSTGRDGARSTRPSALRVPSNPDPESNWWTSPACSRWPGLRPVHESDMALRSGDFRRGVLVGEYSYDSALPEDQLTTDAQRERRSRIL